ncbi:MAG: DNA adenine methylase [Anaerovoracaceae bacterium]
MQFYSPLRYPGGKRKLANFIKDAIVQNGILGGTYIEPFAGGASVALHLLFNNYVEKVIINDIDRSIYSFWYCVLNDTKELCDRINDIDITVEEWEKQRIIQLNKENAALIDLAFSTFFLNRTNRSGIIKGGIIGGKEQSGNWKIDARFNKANLIQRIEKIATSKDKISVHCLDSMDLINSLSLEIDERTLIYFDPPYYNQGSTLYVNHFTHEDHVKLSDYIKKLECKWILTYDETPEILGMYDGLEMKVLTLSYTASNKTRGREMLAFSEKFIIPKGSYSAITIE